MGLILGGVSANDLILDGKSVSLYVGGNPPTKVWPTRETVQITLGSGYEARDQFRAALVDRGLDYRTVEKIPFDIDLVGSGSAQDMFNGCTALTSVPDMDTSQVTNMTSMFAFCPALTSVPAMDTSQVTTMTYMFNRCSSLTTVPAMNTSRVTDMRYMFLTCTSLTHAPAMDTSSVTTMNSIFSNCAALTYVPDMVTGQATDLGFMFYNCSALTDGNVRLIGKHPSVNTMNIIANSGMTRQPFYNASGNPIDVYAVSFSGEYGSGKLVPLVNVTVPAGEVWTVRVQGQFTRTTNWSNQKPQIRIGPATSSEYSTGEVVDFSGTVNSSDSTIAAVINRNNRYDPTDFTGTVTIEK